MKAHEPWAPWRYVTEVGATGRTVQDYREFEMNLRLGMAPRSFGQLKDIVTAAETTTRIILNMMDASPNVLGADAVEDKP